MTSAASAFPSRPASPSSSGVPASGPVVRLRDPGELLAGVPFLLGFHPRESLVLLALGGSSGRRVGLVQRVDLPPPEHAAAVCAALAANAAPAAPAGAAVLVVGGGTGADAAGADAAGADAAGAGGGRADAG
ncbi:MAG TPA: DUF4192 family protein, partial [Pseudonocardia sp.]